MKFTMKSAGCKLAFCLCMSMLLHMCVVPVRAQNRQEDEQRHKRAIIVSAEQPNVWTLEQAHYLLAQMHRRNLDLKASGLGELNPNEINGLNFDVLRTLVEFGVQFDDAARFNNSLLKPRKTFDADRAIRLQKRRDDLADESLALNRDIARLGREKALATSQEEKDTLSAQITELTAVRDANDKEVARLDNDLKTAGGPTGDVQATDAQANFDPNKLPKSSFDDSFKEVTKTLIDRFNQSPQLNATLRLDNFIQMQYEIIAKQLTLLRDEVGPGERIIFLEMPQTVNASYDKANNKWAQSWWKVVGYTAPYNRTSDVDRMLNLSYVTSSRSAVQQAQRSLPEERRAELRTQQKREQKMREDEKTEPNTPPTRETREILDDALDAFGGTRVITKGVCTRAGTNVFYRELDCGQAAPYAGDVVPDDRSVRTVELIPRQSSLNVNDIKLRARAGVLTAVAKTLFGFGARLNVQRQRETFSQFVQQELYSSGFGKGAREFGWTFNPMPGTDRVMSGVRTTYAVLVVPAEAETLVVQSAGCYFPRSEYQPNNFANTDNSRWTDASRQSRNCSETKSFIVPIPGGGNSSETDFWVGGLEYTPVKKGESVVLIIYGKNFTPQLGLLVDGVPLTQAIGLAQPLILDDSAAGERAAQDLKNSKVRGRIERIDSEQMVAVFERVDGKEGMPVLTVTSPGKAKNLNSLKLKINGTPDTTLAASAFMFGKKPGEKEGFRIDKVDVFRGSPPADPASPNTLVAVISGAGFIDNTGKSTLRRVMVNGNPLARTSYSVISSTLLRAEFPVPSDENIRITLVAPNADPEKETIQSDAVANPARLSVANVSVVSFEAATEEEPNATLVIKIEGSGFTDDLKAFIGEGADQKILDIAVKSATEAILKIDNPEAAAVVMLEDTKTHLKTKFIVTRKTQPPK